MKEFLEVYQPPSKTNIWTNGDTQGVEAPTADDAVPEVAVLEDESDDEYQVIAKKPKTDSAPDPSIPKEQPVVEDEPMVGLDEVEARQDDILDKSGEPAGDQGPVSDADWLRSRTNRVLELVDDDDVPMAQPSTVKQSSPKPQVEQPESPVAAREQPAPAAEKPVVVEPSDDEENKIRETGRLYLRNLHYEVSEDEIREQFTKHGTLEEVSHNNLFFFCTAMQ